MQYRKEIDGLRALSIISVILFHIGFPLFGGGYVGVDIFFVISGFLITSIIYEEIRNSRFSYINFYKRRIARLFPALMITLIMVLSFGFILYDNYAFDNLGKDSFFSALGAANILYAQGVNYFAQNESVRPLIHMWSLGVEEQFYLVWPTLLILFFRFFKKHLMSVILITLILFLFLSIYGAHHQRLAAYFYPQYRAFELLLGTLGAIWLKNEAFHIQRLQKVPIQILSFIALILMVAPIFLYDKATPFPGWHALIPTFGAFLFLLVGEKSIIARWISNPLFIFLGLISYPLYLYHQPILSAIAYFHLNSNHYLTLLLLLLFSIPLAWLTYCYLEKPIRKKAHSRSSIFRPYADLLFSVMLLGAAGFYIAKHDGLPWRFQYLNPFAYQVSLHSAPSFHQHFHEGYEVHTHQKTKVLFVGDSVLQQYVYPISESLDLNRSQIDVISYGGCLLLKDVSFQEKFSGFSCNGLREKLYSLDKLGKHYDYVIFSQQWDIYDRQVQNFGKNREDKLKRWDKFISPTIDYFSKISEHIILLGEHLSVQDTDKLKPTIFLTPQTYHANMLQLHVENQKELARSKSIFDKYRAKNVTIIHPKDIWEASLGDYTLHDEHWSYFSDHMHASNSANPFLIERFHLIFKQAGLK